jgi:hypothetical protein
MAHRFDIIINGAIQTFSRFEDIPETFDHLFSYQNTLYKPVIWILRHSTKSKITCAMSYMMYV